jgi:hypothetical protein
MQCNIAGCLHDCFTSARRQHACQTCDDSTHACVQAEVDGSNGRVLDKFYITGVRMHLVP